MKYARVALAAAGTAAVVAWLVRRRQRTLKLQAAPLSPVGVAVALHGVDLTRYLQDLKAELRRLVAQHGLLVLSGLEGVTPALMTELMTAFGKVEGMVDYSRVPADVADDGVPGAKAAYVSPEHPHVRLLGNSVDASTGKSSALLANIGYEWHQDLMVESYTMLHCVKPVRGADTLFASCAQLFGRLSPEQQAWALQHDCILSNASTAGGPVAFDAAYGVRMNATGTRRVRPAARRRKGWVLGETRKPLCGRTKTTAEALLWAGAKNLERLVPVVPGLPELGAEESADKMEELMVTALAPIEVGELDDDLQTVSATRFSPDVVLAVEWQPGMACIWDNTRVLHSTTPLCTYEPGERVMWQIILSCEGEAGAFLGVTPEAARGGS
mmetsp:Transcript_36635/g.85240  ORF Transcript_36635/g.85240 Transcript_36635/m.85240 type:complete len:384 (+) Transcript_36635:50-1201(+)